MNRLPEAWIAPPATRQLRELVRYRASSSRCARASSPALPCRQAGVCAVSDLFGIGAVRRPGAARRRLRAAGDLAAGLSSSHPRGRAEQIAAKLHSDRG